MSSSGNVEGSNLSGDVLEADVLNLIRDNDQAREGQRPRLPHSFSAPARGSIWDDTSTLAPSLRSTATTLSHEQQESRQTKPPPPKHQAPALPNPFQTSPKPSPKTPSLPANLPLQQSSTLTYLRTHQDNPSPHTRKTQASLTKDALQTAKHQKTQQKTTALLNAARKTQHHLPPPTFPPSLTHQHILTSPSLYISLLLFQIGLNSGLILLTIIITRIHSHQIVTLLGEELVFGMVVCVGIMGMGVIWGCMVGVRYGVLGGGGRDLFGLWEVSMPGEKGGKGKGEDLEAGFGVGDAGGRRVRVVRLCVRPNHHSHSKLPDGLNPKTRSGGHSDMASTSRHNTTTAPSPSSPPIPTISIQPPPTQTGEPSLSQFIHPPPPATRRSSMRSRPHSRVYTQDIQLNSLRPDGTSSSSPGQRKEKTLSLQLRDMPEIENQRDRRTRELQEVDDDVFIVGSDEDDE